MSMFAMCMIYKICNVYDWDIGLLPLSKNLQLQLPSKRREHHLNATNVAVMAVTVKLVLLSLMINLGNCIIHVATFLPTVYKENG